MELPHQSKVGDTAILDEEAYVSRALDLSWVARKLKSGELIGTYPEKTDAQHAIKALGYRLIK